MKFQKLISAKQYQKKVLIIATFRFWQLNIMIMLPKTKFHYSTNLDTVFEVVASKYGIITVSTSNGLKMWISFRENDTYP